MVKMPVLLSSDSPSASLRGKSGKTSSNGRTASLAPQVNEVVSEALSNTMLVPVPPACNDGVLQPLFLLFLVRTFVAWRAPMDDCDEVFNFWEPIHYHVVGHGFKTWEYASEYGIRTWAFVLLYSLPCKILWIIGLNLHDAFSDYSIYFSLDKTSLFYLTRFFAVVMPCFFSEMVLVRSVAKLEGARRGKFTIARYFCYALALAPGMFAASGALLPSSFYMVCANFVWALWIRSYCDRGRFALTGTKSKSGSDFKTLAATALAVVITLISGWPFAALVFVFFFLGVLLSFRAWSAVPVGLMTVGVTLGFMAIVDYEFYGTWVYPVWNAVLYNTPAAAKTKILIPVVGLLARVFTNHVVPMMEQASVPQASDMAQSFVAALAKAEADLLEEQPGSELYGVAPLSYYPKNLALNFNFIFLFACLGIAVSWSPAFLWRRIMNPKDHDHQSTQADSVVLFVTETSMFRWLTGPFFTWVLLLCYLPHKEERFLFPVYPLVCLFGVVGLAVATPSVRLFWLLSVPLSIVRIFAQVYYYSEPVYTVWEKARTISLQISIENESKSASFASSGAPSEQTQTTSSTWCLGNDWYRFPGHFFLHESARAQFIKTKFDGILPAHFPEARTGIRLVGQQSGVGSKNISGGQNAASARDQQGQSSLRDDRDLWVQVSSMWRKPEALRPRLDAKVPPRWNNQNREEHDRYVPESQCDFLVDGFSKVELEKVQDRAEYCRTMIDNSASRFPFRSFYLLPLEMGASVVPWLRQTIRKYLEFRYFCIIRGEGNKSPRPATPRPPRVAADALATEKTGTGDEL
ncbi:unnamed protein product [Amoebophrya sp. A25]|nr:unnamed protein product [Amoebophrya sp. A25]|eukprot:GSA25T00000595001.1